jgi:hypothetical protein
VKTRQKYSTASIHAKKKLYKVIQIKLVKAATSALKAHCLLQLT